MTSSPSITGPLYGATLPQAVFRFWAKYATFSGRASRSEFWFACLFVVSIGAVLFVALVFGVIGGGTTTQAGTASSSAALGVYSVAVGSVYVAWGFAVIVPILAIAWRRLHDTNRSGIFALLCFMPFVGIVVPVLLTLRSKPAGVRFDRSALNAA